MVVGDQLWIELDIGQGNGVGRDFAKFQACKANSPIYPNYLEARFYTGNTNYLASLTAGTPYRWYNNYNDALTYALTGQ